MPLPLPRLDEEDEEEHNALRALPLIAVPNASDIAVVVCVSLYEHISLSLIHFFSIFPRENNVFFFEIEKKKRILFVTVIPRAISKMSRSSTTSSSTSSSSLSESEEDEAESLVKAAVAATAKVFFMFIYLFFFFLSFFLSSSIEVLFCACL